MFVVAYQVFGLVCHQVAERLVHIGDYTLRLCPRCIGMHGGFFAAVIFLGRLIARGKGRERYDVWLIPLAAVAINAAMVGSTLLRLTLRRVCGNENSCSQPSPPPSLSREGGRGVSSSSPTRRVYIKPDA